MKNKKRFVPWLIAAVIIAALAVIGKKLYDLMFGGSLAVTTEDLKNGIIACSPAIIFIVVVLIAALIVVVAAGKLKQPKRALVRAQAPIAILLAITLSVNWVILGVEYSVVNSVFAEDVKVSDETMASGRAIADQIASEGIVLLKNDDKALPLSAGTKLNLFGWSSVRPLYGGTGSGDSDTSNAVSLIDGLKHSIYQTDAFSRVASVSGSLWFPGIKEHVVSRTPVKKPADIFFSLGDRECRTQNSLLRCVQQNTESIERYYHEQGIDTTFQLNPGNHFKDVVQRTAAGLQWLLSREYDP